MHILLIAGWYPNPEKSIHHGIFIKRHAEAIALKHRVTVLHIYAADKNETKITENRNLTEVLVSYKKTGNSLPLLKSVSSFLQLRKTFLCAYKLIVERFGKPEIIHQHIIYPQGIFAAMLSKMFDIPLVISEQWSGYLPEDNSYTNFITQYFTKKTIQKASAITTVSKALMQAMQQHNLRGNYHVVPNIVDLELFKPNTNKTPNTVCKIIHVSSLNNKEKNISCMLSSLQLVKEKGYNFELTIIGDSNERKDFEEQSKKFGLTNYVHFLGAKTPQLLVEYYQQADFFLLSSNYETFCVVLIEALATGLPIVATNVGAVSEIVNEMNGLMAQANNPESLAEKVIQMIKTYHNYNKQDLRNAVSEKFTPQIISEKFDAIYQKNQV